VTRVVVALGGNALLRRGEPLDAEVQRANIKQAAASIAELAAEATVVVTHGNGPQVGMLALESAADQQLSRPYPLDVLGAETEGMIGYLLEQELHNQLPGRHVATLLTQTVVSLDDPAFAAPTKPIGPVYDELTAKRFAVERGWAVRRDGAHWRRVVASPEPLDIVELEAIRILVTTGVLVICCGGGGIPVAERAGGGLTGVEAVVDKDLAAAVLAEALDADALLLLTDVPSVVRDWGTPAATPIRSATPSTLRRQDFAAGSMGPKVDAACRFVERTGGIAAIGQLTDAVELLYGAAGTRVSTGAGPDLQKHLRVPRRS
jgi:carbamate kinase